MRRLQFVGSSDGHAPATVSATTQPDVPIVELRGVSKAYRGVAAVADIDFAIRAGEFVTLLGPSGSGKTTLLNIIVGTIAPTSGILLIAGHDATRLTSGQRQIGMVFQNYALMPHMTVFENVAFPLEIRRVGRKEIRQRVQAMLEVVGLPHLAERRPRELSGGQQQRVSLARCLVYNPSLILMDEPLGALDRKMREQMQLEIKRIHTELGVTMLYVTHDQDEALTMSDRVILMNQGHIEQIATPDELYFRPATRFAAAFLGDSNLFSGQVVEVGTHVVLRAQSGDVLRARYEGTPPALHTQGAAMVRPENVTLRPTPFAGENGVVGTMRDSILLGGVVKHLVRLPDGTDLLAQELNRVSVVRVGKGDPIWACWRPEDTLFLPQGTVAEADG